MVTCSSPIDVAYPEATELFDISEIDVKVTQTAPGSSVRADVSILPTGDWSSYVGVAYIIEFQLWWENIETESKTERTTYETPQIDFSMIYPNPYKVPVTITAPSTQGRWKICGEVTSYTPMPLPY